MTSKTSDKKNRSIGAFVGLAIGDALGAPIQFKRRDTYQHVSGYTAGGTLQLDPGYWTDDTSMALCLAEALLEKGTYDPIDFGDRLAHGDETVIGHQLFHEQFLAACQTPVWPPRRHRFDRGSFLAQIRLQCPIIH